MIIGLDLDNTIISYDKLFARLGRRRDMIPAGPDLDKTRVRDWVRQIHGEEGWRELQALAYGPHLSEAELFPGVRDALVAWERREWRVVIVSHKTAFSVRGGFELRSAALDFLRNEDVISLISAVHFVDTEEEKLNMIRKCRCRVFVDDLPEILFNNRFPEGIQRILFDPSGRKGGRPGAPLDVCSHWSQVLETVERLVYAS